MNMHRRATMFALLGAEEAKEWLQGYNDRIIGLSSDDYSMQGIRGWLEADTLKGDEVIDALIVRFENQTRYIFDCPACARAT